MNCDGFCGYQVLLNNQKNCGSHITKCAVLVLWYYKTFDYFLRCNRDFTSYFKWICRRESTTTVMKNGYFSQNRLIWSIMYWNEKSWTKIAVSSFNANLICCECYTVTLCISNSTGILLLNTNELVWYTIFQLYLSVVLFKCRLSYWFLSSIWR